MQINTVSEQIKNFIAKRFPLAQNLNVNNDQSLLESGILDSLGIVELVTYLEEEFNIQVSDEDLVPENFQTIERLTAFIQQKSNSNSRQVPLR